MKTKLLKKIRKRYVIEQITYVDSYDNTIIGDFYREFNKLPFFFLYDNKDWWWSGCSTDKEKIFETLRSKIRIDYGSNKKRKLRTKSKKIWYNQ